MPSSLAADDVLSTVVHIIRHGGRDRLRALDNFPAALYVTDADGFVTYFNPACIDFSGRQPSLGHDRWCVTWRLYTNDGDFLPHHRCPMALTIRSKAAVRGATAIAERPNGSRVNFMPFPMPVMDDDGKLLGAVNVLVDVGGDSSSALRDFADNLQLWRSALVESALTNFTLEEIRNLKGEMETELERQVGRVLH